MSITRQTLTQLKSVADEGLAAHSGIPAADFSMLDVVGLSVNLSDFLPRDIGSIAVELALHFLVEQLPQFQAVMDSLEGNRGAIEAHCDDVKALGAEVIDAKEPWEYGKRKALESWTGEAADEFGATVGLALGVYDSLAKIPPVISEAELATASYVGAVRNLVRQGVHDLIEQVVSEFVRVVGAAIAAAAAGAAVGGARGFASGLVSGVKSGHGFGAIGDAISGGVDGAIQGAIDAAVATATAWANLLVADYLEHFANLIEALTTACSESMGHVRGLGQTLARASSLLQGKGDPGAIMTDGEGSYSDQLAGADPRAEDIALAELNELFPWDSDGEVSLNKKMSEDSAPLVPIPGTNPPRFYRPIPDDELRAKKILDPGLLHNPNGFTAGIAALTDEYGNIVEPPKYVVIMGGTTDGTDFASDINDVVEDGIGALATSQQSASAIALTTAIQDKGLGDDLIFTGHSLGGRLASVSAMATGSTAVTFNAAGVSDPTYAQLAAMNGVSTDEVRASSMNQIRSYQTSDDILTWAQEQSGSQVDAMVHDAAGARIMLQGTTDPIFAGISIAGHGTDNMVRSMGAAGTVGGWAEFAQDPTVPRK